MKSLLGLVLLVVVFGGAYTLIIDSGLAQISSGIPDLAFYGETSSNAPTGITCNVNQTIEVLDHAGFVIETLKSKQYSGSPQIAFDLATAGTTGKGIESFNSIVKIWCDSPNDFQTLTFPFEASSLTLQVFVQEEDGDFVKTYAKTHRSWGQTFKSGDSEKTIVSFHIDEQNISDVLPAYKSFDTTVKFQISGFLHAQYQSCESCKFTIPITVDSIPVNYKAQQFQTDFTKECDIGYEFSDTTQSCFIPDQDKDGIGDFWDKCDTQEETWNQFEDEDGCPDVAPEPEPTPEPFPDPPLDEFECEEGEVRYGDTNTCVPLDPTPSPTEDPQVTLDALNLGKVDTQVDIIFNDGSRDTILMSEVEGALLGSINVNSIVGSLEPTTKREAINKIELKPYFTFDTLGEANKVKVLSQNIVVTPEIRINSEDRELASTALIGFFGNTGKDYLGGKINGVALGLKSISATELEQKAQESPNGITQGQERPLDLTLNLDGTFVVERGGNKQTITLSGQEMKFFDWRVGYDVELPPRACELDNSCDSLNCEENNQESIFDDNGNFLRCQEPPKTEGICITPQRPDGFFCSADWQNENCRNLSGIIDTKNCREPDTDNDGVPNITDECEGEIEDGKGDYPNDGCTERACTSGVCVPPTTYVCSTGQIVSEPEDCPKGTEPKKECPNGDIILIDETCSGNDPEPKTKTCPNGSIVLQEQQCPVAPPVIQPPPIGGGLIDNTLLLMIGGVIVLIGIIAIIASRRR